MNKTIDLFQNNSKQIINLDLNTFQQQVKTLNHVKLWTFYCRFMDFSEVKTLWDNYLNNIDKNLGQFKKNPEVMKLVDNIFKFSILNNENALFNKIYFLKSYVKTIFLDQLPVFDKK
uniref:Integrase family protein n=1 Tax=Pigeon pea witches'-broom phytoplasma TaxID=37700 RepID=A0A059T9W5_PPWBP|nr:hypothetical protein [Pigeon pea witches'-broom phytoplasma]AHN10459.1 integrase family protein [Pigeon pea witches'-broom phytoplasma]